MQGTILVVDDNQRVFESLKPNFRHFSLNAIYAPDSKSALQIMTTQVVNAVLMDIMLGDENGIDLLNRMNEIRPSIPVIMITGYASIETAVKSMKCGAYDYVKKPLDFDQLIKIIERALELNRLNTENTMLKRRVEELTSKIYAESSKMRFVLEQAAKLAQTDIPVLIVGENGSGKEVVADYIHELSDRGTEKLHKINCAAFPESLLDNELFGHEKGAYTGADTTFKGIFERASGSTLFLDEIGDMPLTIQAKILRVLQNHEIRRIGASATLKIDVRFIAATNKNLDELMQQEEFRKDLYYRLNAAVLQVPPLRERRDDISLLTHYFIKEFSTAHGKKVRAVDPQVLALFLDYQWPGNIRELKNAINFGVSITSGDTITVDDLPVVFHSPDNKSDASANANVREEIERTLIEKTLIECRYNKSQTADRLDMSRKTLYAKMSRYGITG